MDDNYELLVKEDNKIQLISFMIALMRKDYNKDTLNKLYLRDLEVGELLKLQDVIRLMSNISQYNEEWANHEKDIIKKLEKDSLQNAKDIMSRMDIMSIKKTNTEDLDFILKQRSFPNIRNMKRLKAVELLEVGKSINEIQEALK